MLENLICVAIGVVDILRITESEVVETSLLLIRLDHVNENI